MDIARFRGERLRKVTPSTVKRDLVLLGHVFEVARREWGVHAHNPVRDIKLPSENRPRDRHLQAGEESRLLEACRAARNPWLLPIVQLALETAMRQGELIRLRREHIDLNCRVCNAFVMISPISLAIIAPFSTRSCNFMNKSHEATYYAARGMSHSNPASQDR
jgi:integrase